jgi:hypothetical protein
LTIENCVTDCGFTTVDPAYSLILFNILMRTVRAIRTRTGVWTWALLFWVDSLKMVPKHVAVDTHHESYFMFSISLTASVGCYIEHKKLHGMSNIALCGAETLN